MRVSLLSGVAFAMPWLVMELYLFIAPGLMPRSRVLLLLAIPAASLLFVLGMAFTYFLMLPAAVPFLYNFLEFRAAWRPSAYFNLVTSLMFWIGITFQMPLVVYALAAVGLLNARQLASQWRVAFVAIAVIAAAITPTVDPVSMAVVMLPLIGLYGFSILGAMVAGAGRRRAQARRGLHAERAA
jgi:sec-independent protein translocase protein TatC